MKNNTLLRVSGYISLAFAILILIDANIIGSIAFFINVYCVGKYIRGDDSVRTGIISLVVLMAMLNASLALSGGVSDAWIDVLLWSFIGYAWYTATPVKPVVAKKINRRHE